MTYEEDYGLDSFSRKWLLVLLQLSDSRGDKKTDILRINKIFRYFEHLLDQNHLDFSNYNLGAVSYELRETVDELEEYDLITEDHGKYQLTSEGEKAEKEMLANLSKQEIKMLEFSKKLLNDMSDDELLFFMYMTFPQTQEHSTQITRLLRKKEELVTSLYNKGKITTATASKWMEISESDFLKTHRIQLSA